MRIALAPDSLPQLVPCVGQRETLKPKRRTIAAAIDSSHSRLSAKGLRLLELQQLFESHNVKAAQYSAQTVFSRMYKEWITDDSIETLRRTHPKVNQGAIDVLQVGHRRCPRLCHCRRTTS